MKDSLTVDIVALLPFIVLIGAMFLMTRSAKNKQRAIAQMRDQMQPGTGVRTIGGLYARVKEVNHDTVVLEVAPGVHATFAKNAIGAVLEDDEYDRIVNGDPDTDPLSGDSVPTVPDSPAGLGPVDLGKPDSAAPGGGDGGADKAQDANPDAGRPKSAKAGKDDTGEDNKADKDGSDAG